MRSHFSVRVLEACALSGLSAYAVAQDASSAASVQADAPQQVDPAIASARQSRTDDQAVASFLNRKKERQAERNAVLQRRGLSNDQSELRRLYRALGISRPKPRAQITAANEEALGASLETDSVQLLQSLGFKPGRVRRLADAGFNPLQAASNYVRGTATVIDYALLSDIVAVARVTEIRDERLGDGFRSTVMLDVTDSIIGRAPSRPIGLRQQSGTDENGQTVRVTSELQAVDGQSYLVMLSSGLYDQLASENGNGNGTATAARGTAGNYVRSGVVYLVQGDDLTPIGSSEASGTTISQLKQTLAPVARAKNLADDAPTPQETGK